MAERMSGIMDCAVIIVAAGKGTRMKTKKKKQFLDLAGKPLLVHTLNKFVGKSFFSDIYLVVSEEDIPFCRQEIIEAYNLDMVNLIAGGASRRESVFQGLNAFAQAPDYVIIHDGVRPLIKESVLSELLSALRQFSAVAVGVPVKDTIKQKDDDDFVKKTFSRSELVAIQTPQAFKFDLIYKAHREIPENVEISDDASLVEKLGHKVKIVEGSYENIKITTPIDLSMARTVIKRRRKNG